MTIRSVAPCPVPPFSGRFIQQLLRHEKRETTQIYAHVSIRLLKEVHTRIHPATLEAGPELLAELAEDEAELAEGEATG